MNWVAEFLETAKAANLCTMIGCTTCGARKFRDGLFRKANDVGALDGDSCRWDGRAAGEIAEALAHLSADFTGRHVKALRLVFFDLWSDLGDPDFEKMVEAPTRETPAGNVLQAMRDHSKWLKLCRAEAESRAEAERCAAQKRREARKVAHAARRAAKVERDRAFRANGSRGPSER
jgi:hypothetical protein